MNFLQRNPAYLLGLAIILIAAALILIWVNLSSGKHAARENAAAQDVSSESARTESASEILVAARDIVRGQTIAAEDLQLRRIVGDAPMGSMDDTVSAIGRVALDDIAASQIILRNGLSAEAAAAGIAALVPEGQRAVSIRVAEEDIVGGFLQAGDRVDVFVTIPGAVYGGAVGQGEGDATKSSLLLQDMTVLAVGPLLSHNGPNVNSGVRTISVAAAPDALARLALAGRLGQLTLAIRNPSDRELAPVELVSLQDLAAAGGRVSEEPEQTENAAKRPTGHRITIYSGANQSTVTTSR